MRVFGIDLVFRQFPVHGIMLLLCPGSPAEPLCISPWKGERKVGASPYALRRGRGRRVLLILGSRVRGNDVGARG